MAGNDTEPLSSLRYFMACYWNPAGDLVHGDVEGAARAFRAEDKTLLRGLLADLDAIEAAGLLVPAWPETGPAAAFWAGLADRSLSAADVAAIRRVLG